MQVNHKIFVMFGHSDPGKRKRRAALVPVFTQREKKYGHCLSVSV